jgi:hypothetical protein
LKFQHHSRFRVIVGLTISAVSSRTDQEGVRQPIQDWHTGSTFVSDLSDRAFAL